MVFPAGSGMKPIYVMFNTPRNQPGVVTGRGQKSKEIG
ncbi:S-type pyocin domain-containing protein [Photorhabdus asymbiotica]|nr:S-type pyocin domain-containing protein [Photorhabdus asymbiotica]